MKILRIALPVLLVVVLTMMGVAHTGQRGTAQNEYTLDMARTQIDDLTTRVDALERRFRTPTATPTETETAIPTETPVPPTATMPAPTSTPLSSQRVTGFVLVNADTDTDIGPLTDGMTVDLAQLPTRNLNIRADTSPATVGSVQFRYDEIVKTESVAPYALFGDTNGNYLAFTPTTGAHVLTATPYTGSSAGGTAGAPLSITFTVVSGSVTATAAPSATVAVTTTPRPTTVPSGNLWYVSTTGSDSNDGRSESKPFRTIGKATSVAGSGTILLQRGGTWTESVRCTTAGQSFGAYGTGDRPHIIGPAGTYALYCNRGGHGLSSIEFTSANRTGGVDTLIFVAGGGYRITDIVAHGSDTVPLIATRGQNGILEHSEFYDTARPDTQWGEISLVSFGCHEPGYVAGWDNRSILRHNYLHDAEHSALVIWGSGCEIHDNLFVRWDSPERGGGFGFKHLSGGGTGKVWIHHNQFLGSGGEWRAMWADFGQESAPVGSAVVMEFNYIENVIYGVFIEATDNTVVSNNTFVNVSRAGIWIGTGDPNHTPGFSQNALVEGNTFTGPRPTEVRSQPPHTNYHCNWVSVGAGSSATVRNNTVTQGC